MQKKIDIKTIVFITGIMDDLILLELALKKIPFDMVLKHSYSSESILDLLETEQPDLLLMDINDPGSAGTKSIIDIRNSKKFNNLPVIIYTTSIKNEHIEECFSNGANYYIIKPYSIKELVEYLTALFIIDWKKNCYFPPRSEFVIG